MQATISTTNVISLEKCERVRKIIKVTKGAVVGMGTTSVDACRGRYSGSVVDEAEVDIEFGVQRGEVAFGDSVKQGEEYKVNQGLVARKSSRVWAGKR